MRNTVLALLVGWVIGFCLAPLVALVLVVGYIAFTS